MIVHERDIVFERDINLFSPVIPFWYNVRKRNVPKLALRNFRNNSAIVLSPFDQYLDNE